MEERKRPKRNWIQEERRKTLGDWVAFCVGCGFTLRYFVELESELCRGRTVVDRWRRTERVPNAHVGIDLDVTGFFDLLLEHGPLTRTRLGELTGLSKPTASQLLLRLEAAGLVVPETLTFAPLDFERERLAAAAAPHGSFGARQRWIATVAAARDSGVVVLDGVSLRTGSAAWQRIARQNLIPPGPEAHLYGRSLYAPSGALVAVLGEFGTPVANTRAALRRLVDEARDHLPRQLAGHIGLEPVGDRDRKSVV